MTGSSKSNQEVSNRIQMTLQAIGPASCQSLAKKEDSKGCNKHTRIRKMFCTILFSAFVIDWPYLAGEFLTVILISHFWFHFDSKMEKLTSISLY